MKGCLNDWAEIVDSFECCDFQFGRPEDLIGFYKRGGLGYLDPFWMREEMTDILGSLFRIRNDSIIKEKIFSSIYSGNIQKINTVGAISDSLCELVSSYDFNNSMIRNSSVNAIHFFQHMVNIDMCHGKIFYDFCVNYDFCFFQLTVDSQNFFLELVTNNMMTHKNTEGYYCLNNCIGGSDLFFLSFDSMTKRLSLGFVIVSRELKKEISAESVIFLTNAIGIIPDFEQLCISRIALENELMEDIPIEKWRLKEYSRPCRLFDYYSFCNVNLSLRRKVLELFPDELIDGIRNYQHNEYYYLVAEALKGDRSKFEIIIKIFVDKFYDEILAYIDMKPFLFVDMLDNMADKFALLTGIDCKIIIALFEISLIKIKEKIFFEFFSHPFSIGNDIPHVLKSYREINDGVLKKLDLNEKIVIDRLFFDIVKNYSFVDTLKTRIQYENEIIKEKLKRSEDISSKSMELLKRAKIAVSSALIATENYSMSSSDRDPKCEKLILELQEEKKVVMRELIESEKEIHKLYMKVSEAEKINAKLVLKISEIQNFQDVNIHISGDTKDTNQELLKELIDSEKDRRSLLAEVRSLEIGLERNEKTIEDLTNENLSLLSTIDEIKRNDSEDYTKDDHDDSEHISKMKIAMNGLEVSLSEVLRERDFYKKKCDLSDLSADSAETAIESKVHARIRHLENQFQKKVSELSKVNTDFVSLKQEYLIMKKNFTKFQNENVNLKKEIDRFKRRGKK